MDLSDDQEGNVALEKSLKAVVDSESSSPLHVQPAKRRAAVTEETETNDESIVQKEKKIKPNEPSLSVSCDEQSLSLNFEDILPRLQQNDPHTFEVKATADYKFPTGYGKVLGEALLHNTMVTKLEMNLALFLPMSDTRSAETKAEQEIQWLLRYLSNNESLVHFAAMGGYSHPKERMSQLIFESVLTCKRLESLKWYLSHCPMAPHRLLSESTSLQELDLAFAGHWWVSATDERVRHMEAAMPSSRLRKLELVGCGQEPLYRAIVRGLSAPDTLRELRLKFTTLGRNNIDSCVEALSEYLRSARTLERLEMENYDMDRDKMTQVLSALTHPIDADGTSSGLDHAVPTVFLSSLSFCGCNFYERSDEALRDFLQTRAIGDNGEIVLQSNLCELRVSLPVHQWAGFNHVRGVMGSQLSQNLADSLLRQEAQPERPPADSQIAVTETMPTEATTVPTIGSQLETLSLRFVGPEFFDHLRANAARVPRLPSLELAGAGPNTCEAFAKCAPFLTTLRTLKVSDYPQYYGGFVGCSSTCKQFLATGICRSASICHFPNRIGGQDGQDIDAYCQRNMELGTLLAMEPPPPPSTDGNDGHIPGDETFNVGTAITADQMLRPSLIQAAAPMPQESRVTMVTRGIFALGQGIGTVVPQLNLDK